jgi:hypothetical protein
MRLVTKTAWATLALLLSNACAKDDAATTPNLDVGFVDAITPPVGGGGGGGDSGGPTETHLRLSYTKEVAPKDSSPGSVDLVIYDFEDNREANLTQGSPEIDCRSKGCTLNRSMTWVAWLAREEGAGFALWIAPVDTQRLRVDLDAKRRVADQVINFEFTNDGVRDLVVYQRGVAEGPEGMLEVRVEPVVEPDAALCANGSPPDDISACPALLGNVDGSGSFRVTPFGALVILIRTTLSTMSLDFFNVRNGANQTLYTFGDQGGTGSEFTGRQPIALSPDAEYLAVTTKNGGVWKLHNLMAAPSPPVPTNVELFEVPALQPRRRLHLLLGDGQLLDSGRDGEPDRHGRAACQSRGWRGVGREHHEERAREPLEQPRDLGLRHLAGRHEAGVLSAAAV